MRHDASGRCIVSDLEFAAILGLAAACILWISLDARREQRERRFARHTDDALKISGPRSTRGEAGRRPRSSIDPGEGATSGRSLTFLQRDPAHPLFEQELP